MARLTIAIPSRNEIFLRQTILSVLAAAHGDIAVYPVLDGYEIPDEEVVNDDRVTYLRMPKSDATQKRHAINQVVDLATGEFVMALDAHCMMADGFDTVLADHYEPNAVLIPRRNRLDAENWCIQRQSDNRPPIDYEYFQWPLKFDPPGLHGFRWDERTRARADILLDDTMEFQGSCWFMSKTHFERMGFMQIDGYTGWGQEAEEIGLTTRMNGGRVLTCKHTSYAHLHKGDKYGRMYHMSRDAVRRCNAFSFDLWTRQRRDFFVAFIESFWPVPGWPADWKGRLFA